QRHQDGVPGDRQQAIVVVALESAPADHLAAAGHPLPVETPRAAVLAGLHRRPGQPAARGAALQPQLVLRAPGPEGVVDAAARPVGSLLRHAQAPRRKMIGCAWSVCATDSMEISTSAICRGPAAPRSWRVI